jgi:hypothetical protein
MNNQRVTMIQVAVTPGLRDIPQVKPGKAERRIRMREYEIVDTNVDNIGGCSFCGNKNPKNLGHRRKTDWLKQRYAEGLRYKVLRSEKFGDRWRRTVTLSSIACGSTANTRGKGLGLCC